MISSLKRVLLTGVASAVVAISAAQQIQVQIDGSAVYFPDVGPQKVDDRVMVPVRCVFEKMGAKVDWNEADQSVNCNLNGTDVVLRVGDSLATVDGKAMTLDSPPIIVADRTLVPMRFLGDALGADVNWIADDNMVSIYTTTTITSAPQALHRVGISQNEVIPATLNSSLSSRKNHVGDVFTATILTTDAAGYAGLPKGTKIEGHIAAISPMQSDTPGILDLAFDRVIFPNGNTEAIDAALVSLDDQYVMVGDDGVYVAQNAGKDYQRMVYAGYGLGDGILVGVNDGRPLDADGLRASRDSIEAQAPEDQHELIDVSLPAGTEIGVRINRDDSLNL